MSDSDSNGRAARGGFPGLDRLGRELAESANEGVWAVDGEFRTTFVNARMAEMLGYSPDQMTGRPVSDFMVAEDLADHAEKMRARQKGVRQSYERRFRHANGSERLCLVSAVALSGDEGAFAGSFDMFTDITERKRADERLRVQAALLDISPASITVHDGRGAFLYANERTFDLHGYTRDEFMALNLSEIDVPESWELFEARVRELERNGEASFGVRHRRKDGSDIPLWVTAKTARMEDRPVILSVATDLIERERAEQAQRESARMFSTLVENLPGFVYRCANDCDRTVTYLSAGCLDVTGYPPEAFVERREVIYRDLVPAEHRERLSAKWRTLLAEREPFEDQYPILHASGELRRVWERGRGVFGSDGGLLYLEGFVTDVTEQWRAEALITAERDLGLALGEARSLHEALETCLSTAIEVSGMDCGGVYLVRGDGGLDLAVQDGMSEKFIRTVTTFDRDTPNARIVLKGDPIYVAWEKLGFRSDGGRREEGLKALASVPVRDRGAVVACLNVASHTVLEVPLWARTALEDVAGRVGAAIVRARAEESQRLAERQYKALFDEMLDGFAVTEIVRDDTGAPVDYRFLAVNPSFERMTGIEAAGAVGRSVHELLPGLDAGWMAACDSVAITGRPVHFDGYAREFDRHFEATVFQPKPGQAACIFADISERKQLEEQFRQSQKMEAVGRLAGGVAHDLNNMLTPILAYTEMLEAAFDPEDQRLQQIREVRAAGVRAKELVQQLLAFSRKQTLRFKAMDLNSVISKIEPLLRHTVRESIRLRFSLDRSIPWIRGDVGQIEQAIMNLVINAQDAMPEGGELVVETDEFVLGGASGPAPADVAPGRYVAMAISDTGVGMDASIMERIFEPFFTTKAVGKGTGLGLATVYGIVKQHGGTVTVRSEVGAGATFRLCFPALEDAPPEVPREEASPAAVRGSSQEIIMVAEDDDMVRDLTAGVLGRLGYTVLTASSAGACVRILTDRRGPLHLMLTDVVMPDMNGKALFDIAATIFPGLRVVFMSGYSQEVISEHGVLLENIDFLQKPFTVRQLMTKVREVLDRK
jgi:two-component system, cell cycle sensor histidine kinase and response regulator CckA